VRNGIKNADEFYPIARRAKAVSFRAAFWHNAAMSAGGKSGLLAIAIVAAPIAWAQDYPVKPIRLVAPFSPGGATDVLARIVGQKIAERLGQPVIIENRVGAGGNIGAELVAKAAPDGYTLLMGGVPHAIAASLYAKLGYDMARDLSAVAEVASFPSMIVLHPALPAKSIKELIALAKARPGQLNFGSAGNGSPNHLALELFDTLAGVKMTHIPYKGAGQVVGDLLAGQLQLASMGLPVAMPHVQAGKLRAIALTGATRSALLPHVPTVAEAGLPGFDVTSWYGVFGPAALPVEIVARLNREIGGAIAAPEMKERLTALGAEPSLKTPEQFAQYVREEIVKWAKIVRDSGAKLD
jgi:tripartite-type tricarboxylate transporter receptor subunit TctC